MVISTRFKPKDEVWILEDGKPSQVTVRSVLIEADADGLSVQYTLTRGPLSIYKDKNVFKSRRDLVKANFDLLFDDEIENEAVDFAAWMYINEHDNAPTHKLWEKYILDKASNINNTIDHGSEDEV